MQERFGRELTTNKRTVIRFEMKMAAKYMIPELEVPGPRVSHTTSQSENKMNGT